MKLQIASLANAVQVGSSLEKHFTSDGGQGRIAYDLELDGYLLHIKKKQKPEEVGFTTVFNLIGGKVESNERGMAEDASSIKKSIKTPSKKD